MARTYRSRYYRRRRYPRRRTYRRRYASGTDRNSFCLTLNEQIAYVFAENSNVGVPEKVVNFGISMYGDNMEHGLSVLDTEKFVTLSKLYDQVRCKGMSVSLSYITNNGTSGETLSMINAVDRSGSGEELKAKYVGSGVTASDYAKFITSASSAKRVTLIGGRKYNTYIYARSIQERNFVDTVIESGITSKYLANLGENTMNYFNPALYSVILRSTTSTAATNVIVNAEIKFYVEFKNSI